MLEKNRLNGVKNVFLMTTNPTVKKWYVCFKYTNSQKEIKIYKKTYILNKSPYVIGGIVNEKTSVLKARLKLANELAEELQEKLNTIEFDVDRGVFVKDAKDILFIKYLVDFIEWKRNKVSASSLKTYQSVVNEITQYLHTTNQQNISLGKVDIYLIEDIINTKQKLSNSRANFYLTVLSNFYKKYLIKYLNVLSTDENIIDRLDRFKEEDSEKHALFNDVNKAFDILTKHKYYLGFMAKVIYYTLHRMDTITKLQFKNFELNNGIINIPSIKIKTSKKLQIRISKHIINDIKNYVESNDVQPNDYWFGYNEMIKNNKNQDTFKIQMFGKYKLPSYTISHHYDEFRKLKTTDKSIFTENHTLYGFKANGYKYYKNGGDSKKFILSDEQIIKITGHSNTDILKKYSREYEATISKELWDSL
ncbi:tyrosine-type recombinase/integrase [Sphingobacterium sp.]|uniref:tyrosine-type recombinase/integrase n=1 Tax=Sphingobacterium sp. TaxID=341027 RepID=UPI002FDAA17D